MEFKDLLKDKDIHGAQVARRLNLDRSTVSAWCTGRSKPRKAMLPRIAAVLGVGVATIEECFADKSERS